MGRMKRLLWFLLIVALLVVGWYYFIYQGRLKNSTTQADSANPSTASDQASVPTSNINWETVERPQFGIKLEMPAGARDSEAPAYNTNGPPEQVAMISSNPSPDTTYAMGWESDPPVARANRKDPQRTLEAARDGMLQRTQTALIQQRELQVGSFPAMELSARNTGGGILDARLIYANGRLYTLIVTFPGLAARRQMDVDRFFHSFTPPPQDNPPAKSSS